LNSDRHYYTTSFAKDKRIVHDRRMSSGIAERHREIQWAEATASKLHNATLVSVGRSDESRDSRSGLPGAWVWSWC